MIPTNLMLVYQFLALTLVPLKIEKVEKEIKYYVEKKKVAYNFVNLNKISIGIN
jgi:hypothetical protein